MEPFVRGLFHAVLVAILTLLLGQVETVLYCLIEWASKRLRRSEILSLWSQMVLRQIRLRSEQLLVFILRE